jgi:hypothetical protein
MNVPTKEKLLELFDRQQRDHPIGDIAARFIDEALKKHPPPGAAREKGARYRRGSSAAH